MNRHMAGIRQRLGNRWRLGPLWLIALLLTVAPAAGVFAARLPVPTQAVFPPGHAEVIAHGVDQLPTGSVVWRVVTDPAKLPADAPTGARDLGFILGSQGEVFVTDAGSGDQQRLASGEAAFVRQGRQQSRASLGTSPATYDAIELVPASDKLNIGAGTFLFASDPFTAPSGRHDLMLLRDVLKPNEAVTLAATDAPTVVLVTAGSATVQTGSHVTTQGPGGAFAVAGAVTVTAAGTGEATFVAAMIGPEVKVPAAASTAATQASGGTLTITTRQCPTDPSVTPSTSPDTLNATCQIVSSGIDFTISIPPGAKIAPGTSLAHPLTLADAKQNSDGSFTWSTCRSQPIGSSRRSCRPAPRPSSSRPIWPFRDRTRSLSARPVCQTRRPPDPIRR